MEAHCCPYLAIFVKLSLGATAAVCRRKPLRTPISPHESSVMEFPEVNTQPQHPTLENPDLQSVQAGETRKTLPAPIWCNETTRRLVAYCDPCSRRISSDTMASDAMRWGVE